MKKLSFTLLSILLLAGAVPKQHQKFKVYSMEKNYFRCEVPTDWEQERDSSQDAEYKIYEIKLLSPKADKTYVGIKYFSAGNEDFKDYSAFIKRNTDDGTGRKESDIAKYSDPKPVTVAGKKAFNISRELKEFESLESKDSKSYWLKEELLVVPAKEGFYVLIYSAKKENYARNLAVFRRVAKTFKPLF